MNMKTQEEEQSMNEDTVDHIAPIPRERVLEHYLKRDMKFISPEDLKERSPRFYAMLASLPRYGENYIQDKMLTFRSTRDDEHYHAVFFTEKHSYQITCRDPSTPGTSGYLGATTSNRIPRVGEEWTRGADLADGTFTKKIFNEIVLDIIGMELQDLEI